MGLFKKGPEYVANVSVGRGHDVHSVPASDAKLGDWMDVHVARVKSINKEEKTITGVLVGSAMTIAPSRSSQHSVNLNLEDIIDQKYGTETAVFLRRTIRGRYIGKTPAADGKKTIIEFNPKGQKGKRVRVTPTH